MKTKRLISLILVLFMTIWMFSGCSEDKKKESGAKENGPFDKKLIEDVLSNTITALRELDVEKASLYILDGSRLEENVLSIPDGIDAGFDEINRNVSKILDENVMFKLIGENTKKVIKKSVSEGLEKGKQAVIDSAEIIYDIPVIEKNTASAELTVKVGGKRFLPLLNGGNADTAKNILMEYVNMLLKEEKYKGKSGYSLVKNLDGVVPDVINLIVDDIRNGEKEEGKLIVYFEKVGKEWFITEIEYKI